MPFVNNIVQEAAKKGPTIGAFCDAVYSFMQMDVTPTVSTAQLVTESVCEPSLLERACAAMMSYSSTASPKPADNSGAGRGKFTPLLALVVVVVVVVVVAKEVVAGVAAVLRAMASHFQAMASLKWTTLMPVYFLSFCR